MGEMRMRIDFMNFANNTIRETNQFMELLEEHEIDHSVFSICDWGFQVVIGYLRDISHLAIARNDIDTLRLLEGMGVVKGNLPEKKSEDWPRLPAGDDDDCCHCHECTMEAANG